MPCLVIASFPSRPKLELDLKLQPQAQTLVKVKSSTSASQKHELTFPLHTGYGRSRSLPSMSRIERLRRKCISPHLISFHLNFQFYSHCQFHPPLPFPYFSLYFLRPPPPANPPSSLFFSLLLRSLLPSPLLSLSSKFPTLSDETTLTT